MAFVTGGLVRAALLRLWVRDVTDDPSASADSTYRACRRSTVVDGLACVLTGLPVAPLALVLGRMLVLGAVLVSLAYLLALADGKLPAVKATELYLLLRWRPALARRGARCAPARGCLLPLPGTQASIRRSGTPTT